MRNIKDMSEASFDLYGRWIYEKESYDNDTSHIDDTISDILLNCQPLSSENIKKYLAKNSISFFYYERNMKKGEKIIIPNLKDNKSIEMNFYIDSLIFKLESKMKKEKNSHRVFEKHGTVLEWKIDKNSHKHLPKSYQIYKNNKPFVSKVFYNASTYINERNYNHEELIFYNINEIYNNLLKQNYEFSPFVMLSKRQEQPEKNVEHKKIKDVYQKVLKIRTLDILDKLAASLLRFPYLKDSNVHREQINSLCEKYPDIRDKFLSVLEKNKIDNKIDNFRYIKLFIDIYNEEKENNTKRVENQTKETVTSTPIEEKEITTKPQNLEHSNQPPTVSDIEEDMNDIFNSGDEELIESYCKENDIVYNGMQSWFSKTR